MTYTKINFADETPASSPVKYEIVDDSTGSVASSATIEPVTTITPGTSLNATNLNHLDTGIYDADAAAAAAQADADAAQADADAAQATADAALALAEMSVYVPVGSAVEDLASVTTSMARIGDLHWSVYAGTEDATALMMADGSIEDVSGGATVTIRLYLDSEYAETLCIGQPAGSETPFSIIFLKTGMAGGVSHPIEIRASKGAGDGTVRLHDCRLVAMQIREE